MKKNNSKLILAASLIIPSILLYLIHYAFFGDSVYIVKDLVAQLAFLPIYYLITTIVIDSIISNRESRRTNKKIYMLVGVFFSEMGLGLLREMSVLDRNSGVLAQRLLVKGDWRRHEFESACVSVREHSYAINVEEYNFEVMKAMLKRGKGQIINLLENQYLMEHESFTDMVLAVFHLCEELEYREDLTALDKFDKDHLEVDILRAYRQLIREWLLYMEHMQSEYPFLFSLAMRKNPFLAA